MIQLAKPQRRKSVRGGAVLAWAAGLFFASQLTLSTLLDLVGERVRFPQFHQQLDRAERLSKTPNVVCLGSSRFGSSIEHGEMTRVLRDVAGDAVPLVFNAHAPAGDLFVSERMLREILRRDIKPTILLVELLPDSVNHRNDWLRLHVARQIQWTDTPRYISEMTVTGNLGRFAGARLLTSFHLRGLLRGWMEARYLEAVGVASPEPPYFPPDRDMPPPADWRRLIDEMRNNLPTGPQPQIANGLGDAHKMLDAYKPGGTSAESLEAILTLCQTHGIQPILVAPPITSVYRNLYTSAIEQAFQAHVESLHRRFGSTFVDCRDHLPDACFVDYHHHNSEGCFLFTRRFTLDMLGPAWRKCLGR